MQTFTKKLYFKQEFTIKKPALKEFLRNSIILKRPYDTKEKGEQT